MDIIQYVVTCLHCQHCPSPVAKDPMDQKLSVYQHLNRDDRAQGMMALLTPCCVFIVIVVELFNCNVQFGAVIWLFDCWVVYVWVGVERGRHL